MFDTLRVSLLCNIFNTAQLAPPPLRHIVPNVPQHLWKHHEACWVSVLVLLPKCVVAGTSVLYTSDLMKPQAKKSNCVKLGERGAQCFGAVDFDIETILSPLYIWPTLCVTIDLSQLYNSCYNNISEACKTTQSSPEISAITMEQQRWGMRNVRRLC
jgi:hypothetical protein